MPRSRQHLIGRGRGYRYGLPNQEYYFKSADEMKALFADLPQAILSTQEIVDKIEPYELAREVLLPKFGIPDEFLVQMMSKMVVNEEKINT